MASQYGVGEEKEWEIDNAMDFIDLKKACSKHCFSLPKIDLLVDATSGHQLLSFLDAFFGYHHIKLEPKDEEKIVFVIDQKDFLLPNDVV